MKRTATIAVDGDFSYICDVTKTGDLPDGRRFVRGVASGVAEDQDGERVSSNALAKMARTSLAGGAVKITSSHDQDWLTEFGDVIKVEHDPEHDELLVECALPPEGVDPIADKAWRTLHSGEKVGFSIGGKLRKAYHELVERGGRVVKRKVLDEIDLRHVALTKKPSYRGTFAEAVAKTFDGQDPDLAAFVDEDVVKAAPTDQDEQPQGAPQEAAEGAGADAPPAGTGDTADAPSDAQDAQQLPEAQRHLSCPNCGEEFAAPMPDTAGDPDTPDTPDTKDEGDAHKTSQEDPMDSITDTVAKLRTLSEDADVPEVAKTDEPAADAVETVEVEKTETADDSDVLKMLAASHRHNEAAVTTLRDETAAGFGEVVKAIAGLQESIAAMPLGRRSMARVLPPAGEVEKTATETDDVAKAETPLAALKALNKQTYGIE